MAHVLPLIRLDSFISMAKFGVLPFNFISRLGAADTLNVSLLESLGVTKIDGH